MTITVDQQGRRFYLRGNTYAIKDTLRAEGAHWDGEQKCWWVGKRDVAEKLAGEHASNGNGEAKTDGIEKDARVIRGRATYQGKSYYVLWYGTMKSGERGAKLAFRDGSKTFWAKDMSAFQLTKEYREPTSLDALERYAAAAKRREAEHGCGCSCHEAHYCHCPSFCAYHHDGCDRCGCES